MRRAGFVQRAGILCGLIMASSAGNATALATDWPDIQGRWREDLPPHGPTRTLPIQLIEIARCGEAGLCGRRIRPDGACGPVVLRLDRVLNGITRGTLTAGEEAMPAYVSREDGKLTVRAFPAPANPLTRRVLPIVSTFDREGPARCDPAVS